MRQYVPPSVLLQPWESMKNWHKGPLRHFGLSDEASDAAAAEFGSSYSPTVPAFVNQPSGNYSPYSSPSPYTSAPATSGMTSADASVLTSLIGAAANVAGVRSGGIVISPRPGQVVSPASAAYSLGLSTNTMLIVGAAVVAGLFLLSKKG